MASGGSCFNVAMLGPCLMSTKRWICLEYEFAFCIYIYLDIHRSCFFAGCIFLGNPTGSAGQSRGG